MPTSDSILRRLPFLLLLCTSLAVAAPSSDRFDPHVPGDALRDRTFDVSPGSRFIWEAWESEDSGIASIEVDDAPSPASIQQEFRVLQRRDAPNSADPNAPPVAHVLKQYILKIAANVPDETRVSVRCRGRKDSPAWTFQFVLQVRKSA